MSLLIVQLASPPRLAAQADTGATEAAPAGAAEFEYVLSADGDQVTAQGSAAAALLPRADSVVGLLPITAVSWQRVTLPKAPASRLRAALTGLLEEGLLDEPDALHLGLEPGARAGQPAWVAVTHRASLAGQLAALDGAGRAVDRVVPALGPSAEPRGHFFDAAADGESRPALFLSDGDRVGWSPLAGSLARPLAQTALDRAARWTSTPAVAAAAERWLGTAVTVQAAAPLALEAASSEWNLLQFDLAPRQRGARLLRSLLRQWSSPAWRPVRLGVGALLLLQWAGLQAYAWSQRTAVEEHRQAQVTLLKSTYPQVRAVLDAPLQMQRQTDALRLAAGQPGEADLETMLSAAAAAWPETQGPAMGLRFEPGQLTLAIAGWNEADLQAFRQRLQAAGWSVQASPDSLILQPPGSASGRRP